MSNTRERHLERLLEDIVAAYVNTFAHPSSNSSMSLDAAIAAARRSIGK